MISFKSTKVKWIFVVSLNLVILGSFVFIKGRPGETAKDTEIINTRLNDIQLQLDNLRDEIKQSSKPIELSSINKEVNKLTTVIEQANSNNAGWLNQLLAENQAKLSLRLDAIHEDINALDKKQHPVKYLAAPALSFKLVSIDSIQQVSMVSVRYNYKTIPLEKGDSLAGWKVVRVDFGKQQAEFENSKKERVLVTLEVAGELNA